MGGAFLVLALGLQAVKSQSEDRSRSIQAEADRVYRGRMYRINREVESIPPWMRDGREGIPERVTASANHIMDTTAAEMDAIETSGWIGTIQIPLLFGGLMSFLALFAPTRNEDGDPTRA